MAAGRSPGPTHYETLGVARNASPAQIRAAYRDAARRLHPDAGGSAAAMQRLNVAWNVLRDPGRRAAYDRTLASPSRGPDPVVVPPPYDRDEWSDPDLILDLMDDDPVGPIRAPEGWWAIAPAGTLVAAIGLMVGAIVFASTALAVFSAGTLFLAIALFILAPLRAMTRR